MPMLFSRLSLVACAATLLMSVAPAMAQETQPIPGAPVRVIPADAMMARMEIVRSTDTDPMRAKLDGKAFGLAPGLRIFSTETLLMNPVTVAGKKFPVRYKLDLYGQLLTAWVMTDAEVKAWKAAH
ncbi:hypothetical protein ACUXAV_001373 [Cupriavidus metallidurans]|uniref:Uncharacterized protein n=1 Tax=Cupriavidus metallidurans (strain ATCC 43123 / DSM 2839 / NBRC 102507 / CH34) TaxID=266264 RepID=Q1LR86_CUPMC|nr:hypothetical protein [Cupriavidus metallidurans]ABF07340.1 conserved hypothetical protein; putative exported protein [Cupriavidus metallidurans CH34]MDE4916761.1 hypothetical protein [Cupriavidus metallidurans]UBM11462.1 hypothetical protein LAI70_13985 [Cupriavidus metallidurans]